MPYGYGQGEMLPGALATTPRLGIQLRHSDSVVSDVFSRDGHTILTASNDHTARLWDVSMGLELRQFSGHSDAVSFAVFSPDNSELRSEYNF